MTKLDTSDYMDFDENFKINIYYLPERKSNSTYLRTEKRIQRQLHDAMATRRIGLRICEVCAGAQVSRPTFYAHCLDCDDALKQYEQYLLISFRQMMVNLPAKNRNFQVDLAFTILLSFMCKNRAYFSANLRNYNLYFLTVLLIELRPFILPRGLDMRRETFCLDSLKSTVVYWAIFEKFNPERIAYYSNSLCSLLARFS